MKLTSKRNRLDTLNHRSGNWLSRAAILFSTIAIVLTIQSDALLAQSNVTPQSAPAANEPQEEETENQNTDGGIGAIGGSGGIGADSPVGDEDTIGVTLSDPVETNWRVGVLVVGGNNPVKNLRVAIPVPADWPEQSVELVEEEFPPGVENVEYETMPAGPRRLLFVIPNVAPKQKILALATYRVSTMQIIAPADTSVFKFPEKKTKETKPYLVPSPEISWRDSKLKRQAQALVKSNDTDWKKVESIFDWVRDNIETRAGEPIGSVKAFKEKSGASEDLVSLFIAMCRANKIPSRMVFVDGTQFAEFYLVDDENNGHWFPANVTGIREFGEIGEPRVILQKGDNIRVVGEKKPLKFVPAAAACKGTKPAAVRFVREPMPIN